MLRNFEEDGDKPMSKLIRDLYVAAWLIALIIGGIVWLAMR